MAVADRYRSFVVDLDGVLFRGSETIPGAPEAVAALRARGRVVFVTNNSARTPSQVADLLRRHGVEADAADVVTSATALPAALAAGDGRPPVRTAYVIGEDGIREALAVAGVEVLDGEPERADAVVVGWDRALTYDRLKRAALLVQRGARLVATNADATYPAPDGQWPGAGSILAAVVTATGADPVVVGKPNRTLLEVVAARVGEGPVLVVGDRLETDVAGAAEMGWDSALVLTGAARREDVAAPAVAPTHVVDSIADLVDG